MMTYLWMLCYLFFYNFCCCCWRWLNQKFSRDFSSFASLCFVVCLFRFILNALYMEKIHGNIFFSVSVSVSAGADQIVHMKETKCRKKLICCRSKKFVHFSFFEVGILFPFIINASMKCILSTHTHFVRGECECVSYETRRSCVHTTSTNMNTNTIHSFAGAGRTKCRKKKQHFRLLY